MSTSSFVPKPFTPFQWIGQNTREELVEKQCVLKESITDRKIFYSWHDSGTSFLEAVFARGDRRLSNVLIKALGKGCRFDGWHECFSLEKWLESFEETGIDPYFYALRNRDFDEILPWDIIDVGVKKEFLISECVKARKSSTTPFCREKCSDCGIMKFCTGWKCNE